MSICVFGEALIDLIEQSDGTFKPFVGGSPFNVARALSRQGMTCAYLSPISMDRFGEQLFKALQSEGVALWSANRTKKPSSLAIVHFDKEGQPEYSLYRHGVADRDYRAKNVLNYLPADSKVLHTGSLALVPEDEAKLRTIIDQAAQRNTLISLDINMRPNVVEDNDAYIEAVNSYLPMCDLVKASDMDLQHLGLSGRPEQLCNDLRLRARAALAIVTLGERGAVACSDSVQIKQASLPVKNVKDTVGAGDCFMAGMLSSLYAQGYLSCDRLAKIKHPDLAVAMRRASASASLNVMQKGCQPPSFSELENYLAEIE